MKKRYYIFFTIVLFLILFFVLKPHTTWQIIYGSFRSFLRMLGAYLLSIAFSFFVGILILHNKTAYKFLFPICDVLQGVPVLGFLPFAVYFFIFYFPKGWLGEELAAIFLIFTGMTWSILFSVVESAASLTQERRDLCRLLGLDGTRYLTEILLPTIYPSFVSATITGWGGGWYFLFACEYLTLGHEKIILPGLGTFIAQSAFHFNLLHSIVGLAVLSWIVLGTDLYLWQPMLKRVRRRWEKVEHDSTETLVDYLAKVYAFFKLFLHKISVVINAITSFFSVDPRYSTLTEKSEDNPLLPLIALVFAYILIFHAPTYLFQGKIFVYAFWSMLRIFIALVLSVVVAVAIALFLRRYKWLMPYFLPLLDIGQSLPAVALFPLIIVMVITHIGGRLGIEVAAIILIFTGAVWYMIFRLIREMENFPPTLDYFARLVEMDKVTAFWHITLPYLFPAIVVGAIQAVGGGWNASIVGEYIVDAHHHVYSIPGLGYLLSYATYNNLFWLSMLAVTSMTLIILMTNHFVWKPLLKKATKFRW